MLFLVVFLDDFLVVAFFFLAAMARVTSFQVRNVKLDNLSVNDFLLSRGFFSGARFAREEKKIEPRRHEEHEAVLLTPPIAARHAPRDVW